MSFLIKSFPLYKGISNSDLGLCISCNYNNYTKMTKSFALLLLLWSFFKAKIIAEVLSGKDEAYQDSR